MGRGNDFDAPSKSVGMPPSETNGSEHGTDADTDPLTIDYPSHPRVGRLLATLGDALEEISLGFDRWEEPRVYGPGMYLAIVAGPSLEAFADPMGANVWPDGGRDPLEEPGAFLEAATETAYTCDGAVVISVDGIVSQQLVRFRMDAIESDLEYEPWMGARHMSALDVSTRPDVIATLTLSEETGRVTVFEGGVYDSVEREAVGGPWRVTEA